MMLKQKELTAKVFGCAYKVYNQMGFGSSHKDKDGVANGICLSLVIKCFFFPA